MCLYVVQNRGCVHACMTVASINTFSYKINLSKLKRLRILRIHEFVRIRSICILPTRRVRSKFGFSLFQFLAHDHGTYSCMGR